jgi:hypothetical protein
MLAVYVTLKRTPSATDPSQTQGEDLTVIASAANLDLTSQPPGNPHYPLTALMATTAHAPVRLAVPPRNRSHPASRARPGPCH